MDVKKYTLKVWGNGAAPFKYEVSGEPSLKSHTNDVALVFEKTDGKALVFSSKCRWILEEE